MLNFLHPSMYISNIFLKFSPFVQLHDHIKVPPWTTILPFVFSLGFTPSNVKLFKVELFFAVLVTASLMIAVGYRVYSWRKQFSISTPGFWSTKITSRRKSINGLITTRSLSIVIEEYRLYRLVIWSFLLNKHEAKTWLSQRLLNTSINRFCFITTDCVAFFDKSRIHTYQFFWFSERVIVEPCKNFHEIVIVFFNTCRGQLLTPWVGVIKWCQFSNSIFFLETK